MAASEASTQGKFHFQHESWSGSFAHQINISVWEKKNFVTVTKELIQLKYLFDKFSHLHTFCTRLNQMASFRRMNELKESNVEFNQQSQIQRFDYILWHVVSSKYQFYDNAQFIENVCANRIHKNGYIEHKDRF